MTRRFKKEESYAAFSKGDKVAEYGLTGLILGGGLLVAAKSGLLAKLWKPIAVGLVPIGAFLKRIFVGRTKESIQSESLMSAFAQFAWVAIALFLRESTLWLPLRGIVLRRRWSGGKWRILNPAGLIATRELGLVPMLGWLRVRHHRSLWLAMGGFW